MMEWSSTATRTHGAVALRAQKCHGEHRREEIEETEVASAEAVLWLMGCGWAWEEHQKKSSKAHNELVQNAEKRNMTI